METLNNIQTERLNKLAGGGKQHLDPLRLIRETDRGFKILTARLNKVIYQQGIQKLEHQTEGTYTLRPHCGIYFMINTNLKETPLYIYLRK